MNLFCFFFFLQYLTKCVEETYNTNLIYLSQCSHEAFKFDNRFFFQFPNIAVLIHIISSILTYKFERQFHEYIFCIVH